MTFSFDLTGRTALVTGASSGLGTRFGRILAASGAKVALGARRADRLAALASEIGPAAAAVTMDVAREADIIAGFNAAAGTVDFTCAETALFADQQDFGAAPDETEGRPFAGFPVFPKRVHPRVRGGWQSGAAARSRER